MLMPLWEAIARSGDVSKAYPDELLSLDAYTKGRVKAGDEITADNVEHVRDLLDTIRYEQVAKMGRRLRVAPTTTDVLRLSPWEYVEATLRRMADSLFAKVREEGHSVRTLTVKVRYNDMAEDQLSDSLYDPTDLETDVYGRLHEMLRRAWKLRVSLRLVTL